MTKMWVELETNQKKEQNLQSEHNIIDVRNISRVKKENEAIKVKIILDIKSLFEQEQNYYKPVRVGNFNSNNYIIYERNGDRNQTLSIKE